MQIVHLLTYLDSQTGGMERQALQLAKKLRELGHEIFFITCAHVSRMWRDGLRIVDRKDGFRVYRIPIFRGTRYLNTIIYGIGTLFLLVLNQRRYRLIHAHQLYTSGLVASFVRLFLRSKKVVIKNAAGGDECGDVAELKRLVGSRFCVALLRRMTDQFISVSPQTTDEMHEIGFKHVMIIPNGVDTNRFHPLDKDVRHALRQKLLGTHAGGNIVLFVGRFSPEKNLFTLLDDVFVLPSHSEGCPNTLLEAMSRGVPSVGSDIPAVRYIIKEGWR